MKANDVFYANIMKCENYDIGSTKNNYKFSVSSKLYKKNATIIRIKNIGFVCLDDLTSNSLINFLKIKRSLLVDDYSSKDIVLPIWPTKKNGLFIDMDSIRPYYVKGQKIKNVKVKQLKLNQMGGDIIH